MKTMVLQGESQSSMKLIAELAKKIGVSVRIISDEEREDMGLLVAMKASTEEYVDTETVIKALRK